MSADIAVLKPSDDHLAPGTAALVNRVYADAEKGLWRDDTARTTTAEITQFIRTGQLAAARLDGVVVGAVRVQRLSDTLAEFGMLVAAPEHRGIGLGRDLVTFAETWARSQGLPRMQLELLTPRTWSHPVKDFLRAWYERLGYQATRTADFADDYPTVVPRLATPCDFVIFEKTLTVAG
ncbi:GNAT family N-acetyltransferase [Actinoplanes solisilvae]|uniref:GNAT family N-acetyltransferase n=1 Tax=Actinoplanes solisilvae TaxID=2486853 RepID=UPI001F0BE038|nr:GNAT family N-acetyltransferase [Actinoplanes solisilvae]